MFSTGNRNRDEHRPSGKRDAGALVYAALTDIGMERSVNEDRCASIETPLGTCYLVLDGMGGVDGGEFAAQLSIDAINRSFLAEESAAPEIALRNAIYEANRVIVLRRQSKNFREMGTTIVAALVRGSEVLIAHVGDSRAYVVRETDIRQLTVDHTYVQHLVETQKITKEEALPHPQSHILTQCIGASATVRVDTRALWVWPKGADDVGDLLVLCTDGLYSMVSDEEIEGIVKDHSPTVACEELVKLANQRGGYDNVTVAIIPIPGRLREEPSPAWKEEETRRQRRKVLSEWWERPWLVHLACAALGGFVAAFAAVGVFFWVNVF